MINSGVTFHPDPHKFSAYGGPRVWPFTKSIPPDWLLLGTVLSHSFDIFSTLRNVFNSLVAVRRRYETLRTLLLTAALLLFLPFFFFFKRGDK